jgi:hypothetical protein
MGVRGKGRGRTFSKRLPSPLPPQKNYSSAPLRVMYRNRSAMRMATPLAT